MKTFPAQGPGHSTVRTDQPQVETQLFGDGKRERVAASRDQHDFNSGRMRAAQRGQIAFGDLKLWIEQRTVDIRCQQPDGSLGQIHHL